MGRTSVNELTQEQKDALVYWYGPACGYHTPDAVLAHLFDEKLAFELLKLINIEIGENYTEENLKQGFENSLSTIPVTKEQVALAKSKRNILWLRDFLISKGILDSDFSFPEK
ncbi:hypothetical protein ACFLY0_01185 [Patescibacteria group bacterium]